MQPDFSKVANSLSLLKNFTRFVLKRKDNGIEEGMVFLQVKNKEDIVCLDKFILERPNNERCTSNLILSSPTGVPQYTKIKGGSVNHDAIQSSSNPQLLIPENLPPTLSITFNPRISTSTCLTSSYLSPNPSPVASSNQLTNSIVDVGRDITQRRSSARLRLKSSNKVTELCGQQSGSRRGLDDVNIAVAGKETRGGLCTIRATKERSNTGLKSKGSVKNRDHQEELSGKDEIKSEDQEILKEREVADIGAIDLEELKTDNVKKLYSNNLANASKTICQICHRTVTVVAMRGHTRKCHNISIADYSKQYGNPRAQMINPIFYHKCGICSKEMLLDADCIHGHAVQKHKMSLKEYSIKFLVHRNKANTKSKSKNGKPDVNQNLTVAKSSMQSKFDSTFQDVNIRGSRGHHHHLSDETNILPPRKRNLFEEENLKGMQTKIKRKKLNTSDGMKMEMSPVKAANEAFSSPRNRSPIPKIMDDFEIKEVENLVKREQVKHGREHVLVDGAQNIVEHVWMKNGPDNCDSGHVQDMLPCVYVRYKSPTFLNSWQTESGDVQNIQSGSQDVKKTSSHDTVNASLPSSHDCGKFYLKMNRSQGDTIDSISELAANRKNSQESDKNTGKSLEKENVYSDCFQDKGRLSLSSLSVIDEIDVNKLQERDKVKKSKSFPAEEPFLGDETDSQVDSQMVTYESMSTPRPTYSSPPSPSLAVTSTPIKTHTMSSKLFLPQYETPPPVSKPQTSRVSFTMKAQGSLVTSQKGKLVCTLAMKPKTPLWKGMAAFGKKLSTTKLQDLEFCCNGQVLNWFQRVEDVEGCTVLVRIKNNI